MRLTAEKSFLQGTCSMHLCFDHQIQPGNICKLPKKEYACYPMAVFRECYGASHFIWNGHPCCGARKPSSLESHSPAVSLSPALAPTILVYAAHRLTGASHKQAIGNLPECGRVGGMQKTYGNEEEYPLWSSLVQIPTTRSVGRTNRLLGISTEACWRGNMQTKR